MSRKVKLTQTDDDHRRRFLQTVGAVGITGAFAGCLADDDDSADDRDDTDDGDDADDSDDTDDGDPAAAFYEVRDFEPGDFELESLDPFDVSATIENTGDQEAAQIVEYRIDGEEVEASSVRLEGGASTIISFDGIDVGDYEVGEYTHGIYSNDDEETGNLSIPAFGPPMPDREAYEGIVGMHPEDTAESFSVADGFEIELVAAEPLIDSPVDIEWDAKGRMWVCEMPDYMPIYPGDGRGGVDPGNWPQGDGDVDRGLDELSGWEDSKDDEVPNGAIKVLEDRDGDGIFDTATTFKDELVLSRSLALVEADDALMIAHAGRNINEPDLILCRDTDGDLVADETEEIKYSWVDQSNTEHTSNGLHFMLDNWLHSANSRDKFQIRNGNLVEGSDNSSYGQWGLTEDDWGRTYHTSNSNFLRGDQGPEKGTNQTGLNAGNTVYPIRPSPGTNRFFHRGEVRSDHTLSSPTAISGPGAYWGHIFPGEYVNDVFSPEPKGNCVGHFHLEDQSGGLGISSTHETYNYNATDNPYENDIDSLDDVEFVASYDEVFRPVNLRTGPDGALYIVDMYNGIFQHWFFLTAYLADYYYEHQMWEIDNLHQEYGHGAGRIWRVKPEGLELPDPPALDEMSAEELAEELDHNNGWVRRTAQRLIVQGQQTNATETLRDIAQESDNEVARMHALWALEGIGELDGDSVFAVFEDVDNSHVLANAMQAGEALYGTDDENAYVNWLEDFEDHGHDRVSSQASASL